MNASNFPALLQRFFTDWLITQQGASPHTVAAYRDTFRLLLQFAKNRLGRVPSALRLEELSAEFLEKFLEHLEHERGNRPRTRNHRLSALHAFFRYVSLAEPAFSLQCQRILVDSCEALRERTGGVPHRGRSNRIGVGAGCPDMDWPPGSCAPPGGGSNRHAEQRTHLVTLSGCRTPSGCSHSLLREREEDAVYALEAGSSQCPQGLAVGTRRRSSGPGLPQFTRWTT